MTSLINPNNIDTTYPIAGQDNDTQGFRTNFTNIKNNFAQAATEITTLQSNVATLSSGSLSGNLSVPGNASVGGNSSLSGNVTVGRLLNLANLTTAQRNSLSPVNGSLIYNSDFNRFQGYANGSWGNITLT